VLEGMKMKAAACTKKKIGIKVKMKYKKKLHFFYNNIMLIM